MLSQLLSTDNLCAAKCSPAFDLVSLSPHYVDSPNGIPSERLGAQVLCLHLYSILLL